MSFPQFYLPGSTFDLCNGNFLNATFNAGLTDMQTRIMMQGTNTPIFGFSNWSYSGTPGMGMPNPWQTAFANGGITSNGNGGWMPNFGNMGGFGGANSVFGGGFGNMANPWGNWGSGFGGSGNSGSTSKADKIKNTLNNLIKDEDLDDDLKEAIKEKLVEINKIKDKDEREEALEEFFNEIKTEHKAELQAHMIKKGATKINGKDLNDTLRLSGYQDSNIESNVNVGNLYDAINAISDSNGNIETTCKLLSQKDQVMEVISKWNSDYSKKDYRNLMGFIVKKYNSLEDKSIKETYYNNSVKPLGESLCAKAESVIKSATKFKIDTTELEKLKKELNDSVHETKTSSLATQFDKLYVAIRQTEIKVVEEQIKKQHSYLTKDDDTFLNFLSDNVNKDLKEEGLERYVKQGGNNGGNNDGTATVVAKGSNGYYVTKDADGEYHYYNNKKEEISGEEFKKKCPTIYKNIQTIVEQADGDLGETAEVIAARKKYNLNNTEISNARETGKQLAKDLVGDTYSSEYLRIYQSIVPQGGQKSKVNARNVLYVLAGYADNDNSTGNNFFKQVLKEGTGIMWWCAEFPQKYEVINKMAKYLKENLEARKNTYGKDEDTTEIDKDIQDLEKRVSAGNKATGEDSNESICETFDAIAKKYFTLYME